MRGPESTDERLVAVLEASRGPGTCRSCSAPITWYTTHPKGRKMPFTGDPVPRRSELVDGQVVVYMPAADSHFATCPQGPSWSKGRK